MFRWLTHTRKYQRDETGDLLCACGHPRREHYPSIKYCSVPFCRCLRGTYPYELVKRPWRK